MGFIKCYDAVSSVIDMANDRFAPIWRPDKDKMMVLERCCESIDSLSEEFDTKSLDVDIDEISMDISITLECDEVITDSTNHALYDIIKRTVRYGFSYSDDENLFVKFVFPSIWEKA